MHLMKLKRRLLLLTAWVVLPGLVLGCRSASTSADRPVVIEKPVASQQLVELQTELASILNRNSATGAVVSARVLDADTGAELFALNASKEVIPASNMKLPISAATLDTFGPNYQWKTQVATDGTNLWIIGHGDPALGDDLIEGWHNKSRLAFMDELADQLKSANLTQFDNLYLVDDFFDSQVIHPTWELDHLTFWYAAPVGGLNINGNCIDVTVVPTTPGEKPRVVVVPATFAGIEVINQAVTVSAATTRATSQPAPDISREQDKQVYTVTGAVFEQDSMPAKPVIDPGLFTAQAMRAGFETRGIRISGSTQRRTSADARSAKVVVKGQVTTTMLDVLKRVNQNSQNMFTDACAKLLSPGDVRSWESGSKGVQKFFEKHKIDATGFSMADGSGLSRQNKVSARLISDILLAMHRHENGKTFKQTLAVGGKVGTIRSRFRESPDRVFAKTGMIRGVRSLSGYVVTDEGKTLIFSVIYNEIPGSVRPFEVLQDEAVTRLMKWK
jgi:serine-type D-Ala-D-Ala carboxypeptidase/endopeptidase (penicillin-binding protein 4)